MPKYTINEVQAVGHRVAVKIDPYEDLDLPQEERKIKIPVEMKARDNTDMEYGEVVSIGPQAFKAFDDGRPWYNVGDRVWFVRHAGRPVFFDETEYRFINDDEVYAKVKN